MTVQKNSHPDPKLPAKSAVCPECGKRYLLATDTVGYGTCRPCFRAMIREERDEAYELE